MSTARVLTPSYHALGEEPGDSSFSSLSNANVTPERELLSPVPFSDRGQAGCENDDPLDRVSALSGSEHAEWPTQSPDGQNDEWVQNWLQDNPPLALAVEETNDEDNRDVSPAGLEPPTTLCPATYPSDTPYDRGEFLSGAFQVLDTTTPEFDMDGYIANCIGDGQADEIQPSSEMKGAPDLTQHAPFEYPPPSTVQPQSAEETLLQDERMCEKCYEPVQVRKFEQHLKEHDYPIACTWQSCTRRFEFPCRRRKHEDREHINARPYECGMCGARFNVCYYLLKHLRNQEKKVEEDEIGSNRENIICAVCKFQSNEHVWFAWGGKACIEHMKMHRSEGHRLRMIAEKNS